MVTDKEYNESKILTGLHNKERILIKTDAEDYFMKCVDLLQFLVERKQNVVIVTFDSNTRDLIETLQWIKKVNVARIKVVDTVDIFLGRGSPPVKGLITVSKPTSFTDIEIYTNLFIREFDFEDVVVFFMSLNKIEEYEKINEVGIFLTVFAQQLTKQKISEIIIVPEKSGAGLNALLKMHSTMKAEF